MPVIVLVEVVADVKVTIGLEPSLAMNNQSELLVVPEVSLVRY